LAAGEAAGDLRQISISIYGLAALATKQGDFAAAQKLNEQGLAVARESGDESIVAHTLGSLGDLLIAKKEWAAARPFVEESLTLSEKLGNRQLTTINLVNLGMIAHAEKNYEAAGGHFSKALTTAQDLGNKILISCSLDGLAAVAVSVGDAPRAVRLAGAADSLRAAIGYRIEPAERYFRDAYVTESRRALDEQTFAADYARGLSLELSEAVALATSVASKFAAEPTAEIVIESHTYSKIVIEEEFSEETDSVQPLKIVQTLRD
jgi:tetratricopeptide (TPR) repeat protein